MISTSFSEWLIGVYVVLDWYSTHVPWLISSALASFVKRKNKPQTKRAVWELSRVTCTLLGTDCSSWMFKSVLSQRVNGLINSFFSKTHDKCCFIFCLFSPFYFLSPPRSPHTLLFLLCVQWACLEITHNAQPHKLTDCCMGSRCYQVKTVSLSIRTVSRWAITASLISCFLPSHVCVIDTTSTTLRKMPATRWYLTRTPSLSVCVCVTSAQARIALLLSGVIKGYLLHFYSIYAVLKCQMLPYFFVFVFDVHLKKKKRKKI